ncbi:MAG: hypothetical protein ACK5VI_10735 [Opitutia bacterium]
MHNADSTTFTNKSVMAVVHLKAMCDAFLRSARYEQTAHDIRSSGTKTHWDIAAAYEERATYAAAEVTVNREAFVDFFMDSDDDDADAITKALGFVPLFVDGE